MLLSTAASTAHAHLLPPDRATLNVTDQAIFAVISVPVATLNGFDDDGDGQMSARELEAHREALQGDVARRFRLSDGERPTTLVRLDLVLSPEHEVAQDRAEHVVALLHVATEGSPKTVRLWTDLFDRRAAHPHLTVSASRDKKAETAESAELDPGAPEHDFHLGHLDARSTNDARSNDGKRFPRWAIFAAAGVVALGWFVYRRRQTTASPAE